MAQSLLYEWCLDGFSRFAGHFLGERLADPLLLLNNTPARIALRHAAIKKHTE